MARHGTLGIDIGGTKTLIALFDDAFKPVESIKFKTEAAKGAKVFQRHLSAAIETLLEKARRARLVIPTVGVGCAGHIDAATMELKVALNIPFLKDYPLRKKLVQQTHAEVFIGNDVQMALYGEHALGAARGVRNVICIFMGTGIGGAMMIDGKLHTGVNGVAGDIGHYLVQPLGPLGGSDRQGTLDDFASRTAIAAEAAAFASKQWAPALLKIAGTDISRIRSQALATAIKKGDRPIEELVRSRARIVGIVLSNLIDFINPEMVVLGGGLVEEMPGIVLKEVEKGIRKHTTAAALENLKVVGARLNGYAVAAGAAKMAWDRFIKAQTPGRPRPKAAR